MKCCIYWPNMWTSLDVNTQTLRSFRLALPSACWRGLLKYSLQDHLLSCFMQLYKLLFLTKMIFLVFKTMSKVAIFRPKLFDTFSLQNLVETSSRRIRRRRCRFRKVLKCASFKMDLKCCCCVKFALRCLQKTMEGRIHPHIFWKVWDNNIIVMA